MLHRNEYWSGCSPSNDTSKGAQLKCVAGRSFRSARERWWFIALSRCTTNITQTPVVRPVLWCLQAAVSLFSVVMITHWARFIHSVSVTLFTVVTQIGHASFNQYLCCICLPHIKPSWFYSTIAAHLQPTVYRIYVMFTCRHCLIKHFCTHTWSHCDLDADSMCTHHDACVHMKSPWSTCWLHVYASRYMCMRAVTVIHTLTLRVRISMHVYTWSHHDLHADSTCTHHDTCVYVKSLWSTRWPHVYASRCMSSSTYKIT